MDRVGEGEVTGAQRHFGGDGRVHCLKRGDGFMIICVYRNLLKCLQYVKFTVG